jgi:hypothetical protein
MRSLMGYLTVTVTIGLSGCSDNKGSIPSPVAPSLAAPVASAPAAAAPIPLPVPAGPPAFALTVSTFQVQLFRYPGSNYFQYIPEMLELSETSGQSSATLRTLDVDAPGGVRDRDCPDDVMVRGQVIAPGSSKDVVATMGYCVPYADTPSEVSEVSFIATFADDQGRSAQVHGTSNVAGCTLGGNVGLISCK